MFYLLILHLSGFNYSVNNCYVVTVVLEEASLKTGDLCCPRKVAYFIEINKMEGFRNLYSFKCHTSASEFHGILRMLHLLQFAITIISCC
jgi:hypothetical protein